MNEMPENMQNMPILMSDSENFFPRAKSKICSNVPVWAKFGMGVSRRKFGKR